MKEFTPAKKRKITILWNALKPLQRTRVFRLPKNKLFVFNTWDKLTDEQKLFVHKSVKRIIEEAHFHEEMRRFLIALKKIAAKNGVPL